MSCHCVLDRLADEVIIPDAECEAHGDLARDDDEPSGLGDVYPSDYDEDGGE